MMRWHFLGRNDEQEAAGAENSVRPGGRDWKIN